MQRNIELIRYRRFGPELLMLDLVAATSVKGSPAIAAEHRAEKAPAQRPENTKQSVRWSRSSNAAMIDRLEAIRAALMALGDDVQETMLRFYLAFKRIKNSPAWNSTNNGQNTSVCQSRSLEYQLEAGFTRDVSNIGHFGTGDLEITLSKPEDLERAMSLIKCSYENS